MVRRRAFVIVGLLLSTAPAPSWATAINAGQGVTFSQVNYLFDSPTINSATAQVNVDIAMLIGATGFGSGFLNVYTNQGWVVQNLPILPGFTYPSVSTNFGFDSAIGVDVTTLQAYVDYSTLPTGSFFGAPTQFFDVGDFDYNAKGKGDAAPVGPPAPPAAGTVTYSGGPFDFVVQNGHVVVQTAEDQCGPEAVASSLQWLEDTTTIKVPNDHKKGENGDDSLVGQLDKSMNRGFRSRADGDGVEDRPMIEGKLKYIGKNVTGSVSVKHMDDEFGNDDIDVGAGVVSKGLGKKPTADFIISELKHGEDVEVGFTYKIGGGHWVEAVAAGTILGVPFLCHVSDALQTNEDATDTKGVGGVDCTPLIDTDGDGLLNLVYGKLNANLDIVVSESNVVPEPASGILLCTGAALAVWLRKRQSSASGPAARRQRGR